MRYLRYEVILREWFQYVNKLFEIKASGMQHRSLEFDKNLSRIDKILRDFFLTYEHGSARFYGSRFIVEFSNVEEAKELQEFLIKEVPRITNYDVLTGIEDYLSENNPCYLMIQKKSNTKSITFN